MPIRSEKPGLADLPEVVLGGVRSGSCGRPSTPGRPSNRRARSSARSASSSGRVGVELRGEDGGGAALGEVEVAGVARVLGGQVEDHPVEHLDGHRAGREDLGEPVEAPPGSWRTRGRPAPAPAGSARPSARPPVTTASVPSEPTISRARLNCQGSSAPAVGPDGQAGDELVEVVAADPPEDPAGTAPAIASRCRATTSRTVAMDRPPTRSSPAQTASSSSSADGPRVAGGAVGQDDVDRADVIDRLAVAERAVRRPSCCRSSRRAWRGRWSRRRGRTSGRAASGGR